MLRLYYCDHHELDLPEGHRFPTRKYRLTRELLAREGLFCFEPAPLAEPATIALAHDPGYVRAFLEGTLPAAAMRRIGFPWSLSLVRRTLASVGGTLAAARDALDAGFGGTLAGGTHHAFYSEGSGFCVFNDIAVAIRALRPGRAAVVDLDVHQGDGTAQIFQHDEEVLTISLHGRNNFPFRKQQSRIDVALEDGAGDDRFLAELAKVLPAVFEFAPWIVFYQTGVDALEEDLLGRLSMTLAGLRERDRMVIRAAKAYGVPLVATLGGGYAEPIELTAQAHANTFRVAAAEWAGAPVNTAAR